VAREFESMGIAWADLIQEGNFGLMRAVDHFDYRRGFRLSTYARWWVRQACSHALQQRSPDDPLSWVCL
jgi:RNA polymerase sigma factor (sigma-70 family)